MKIYEFTPTIIFYPADDAPSVEQLMLEQDASDYRDMRPQDGTLMMYPDQNVAAQQIIIHRAQSTFVHVRTGSEVVPRGLNLFDTGFHYSFDGHYDFAATYLSDFALGFFRTALRIAEATLITDIPALNVVGLLNGHRYWRRCHNAYVEDAWDDAGHLIPAAKWFCGETSSIGPRCRSYRHADGSAVWVDADGKWWVR